MQYSDLGFDSYDDYLKSEDWRSIRDIFYHSGIKYHCRICHETKGLLVHKRSYAFLKASDFRKMDKYIMWRILVYLCSRCNRLVHFYDNGDKVPLDYLFLELREAYIYNQWKFKLLRIWRRRAGKK